MHEQRQFYIDWLRTGAMLLLIFYHTGRLFDEPAWHIKNAQLSSGIDFFNRFLDIWNMPLFFILAGASVWFSLGKRTIGGFARERLLRLLVPLIFGMLIIIPPQVYIERVFSGDFTGSLIAWYPNTFQGIYSMNNPLSGNLSWHHLWFLAYLFVFSLILLPLFSYFRKGDGKHLIPPIRAFLEKPGAIFLLALPLIAINITLRPIYGWGNQNLINDWANFLFYIIIFFYGFLLVSDNNIVHTIQRNRFTYIIAAIVISLGTKAADILQCPDMLILALLAFACWCWLLAIISFGSLVLNFDSKIVRYANLAVLPVYILHQTIIVVLGFYVIRWDISVTLKYFFIIVATLVSSLVIYELIRRIIVTRFIFGIKS